MKAVTRNTQSVVVIVVVWLILFGGWPANAAPPESSTTEIGVLKEEVERLRAEIEVMRGELRAISQRLGAPPAVRRATVTTTTGAALGSETASIALVEFSDYQCPYCQRFRQQTFD